MFVSLLESLTADFQGLRLLLADVWQSGAPISWCSAALEALDTDRGLLAVGRRLAQVLPTHDFGTAARARVPLVRSDGTRLEVGLSLDPIFDGAGRCRFCLGLVRLVDEGDDASLLASQVLPRLAAACDALEQARASDGHRAEMLLRSVTAGVIASNSSGRIVYANASALRFLQRPRRGTLGKTVAEVLGDTLAQKAHAPGPTEERSEHRLYSGTGRPLDGGVNLIRVENAPEAFSTLFLIRDLAERRQAELELLRLKGLEALDQMAAGFAHEVRNPLAAIKTMAESLMLEFQPGDGRVEFPTRISALVARIEKLVEHSLRMARPRRLVLCPVAGQALVEQALATLSPRYAERVGEVKVSDASGPARASCDPAQISEVLAYLIENALDATASDRSGVFIEVSCQSTVSWSGLWLRIDVKDRGVGISEQHAERLFQPFFTTKAKSLGLSLAIAQRLARDNRGHLVADSTLGVRTVFSLFLPVEVSGGSQ